MNAGLRALLTEIIDYAGLFPPASLPLEAAVQNYARYRQEPENWMLARFICPTAKLSPLNEYRDTLFQQNPPFRFSALGRGGETRESFLENLQRDTGDIKMFLAHHAGRATADAFEARLPAEGLRDATEKSFMRFFDAAAEIFQQAALAPPAFFCEAPANEAGLTALPFLLSAMKEHGPRWPLLGLKLRCGGADAAAVPSVAAVTTVIEQCREYKVPLKFTAGLHHPLRRFDPGLRTMIHGFLNIFTAAVLARAVALDHHDIQAVLEEQDARHFHFEGDFIGWNDAEAALGEIAHARKHVALSFGSCSFDEPRDDLRGMRLL